MAYDDPYFDPTHSRRSRCWTVSAIVAVVLIVGISPLFSQTFQVTALDSSSGAYIKKLTTQTTVPSGVSFQYVLEFSIPAGVSDLVITDLIPSELEYQAILTSSFPAGNAPSIVSPPAGSSGGLVELRWPNTTTVHVNGSISLLVRFHPGRTCNGDSARNAVCLSGVIRQPGRNAHQIKLCTPPLITTATAASSWTIRKDVVNGAQVPGMITNCLGDADDTVHYRIHYWKNTGIAGEYDLLNAAIEDRFSANGGQFVRSVPSPTLQNATAARWSIGDLHVSAFNSGSIDVWVVYPGSAASTQVQNEAWLFGSLGTRSGRCGAIEQRATACAIVNLPLEKGTLSKSVSTNGQPGCNGQYTIRFVNSGNVSLAPGQVVLTDNLPTSLTYQPSFSNVTVPAAFSMSVTGNQVRFSNTANIAPGQSATFVIPFSIPISASAGTSVSNTASVSIGNNPPTSQTTVFTVTAAAPIICAWKSVCDAAPWYTPGSRIRYRLRVQNIGGAALLGATLTDQLPPDVAFAGNASVSSYVSNLHSPACSSTTSNTLNVSTAVSGQTVVFTLPDLPAGCVTTVAGQCGRTGTVGVPFFFVEFDVIVADSAAIGTLSNSFSVTGTNQTAPTQSNTVSVQVTGTIAWTLIKEVSTDLSMFTESVSVSSGSNVAYRLRLVNSSDPTAVALRHIVFADLLPINDAPTDRMMLSPLQQRGSTVGAGYLSAVSSNPTGASFQDQQDALAANLNGISSLSLLPSTVSSAATLFPSMNAGASSWSAGPISTGRRNIGHYFGPNATAPGGSVQTTFRVQLPTTAANLDSACNSFVGNAAVRYRINGTIRDVWSARTESNIACVNVVASTGCIDHESPNADDHWIGDFVRDIELEKDGEHGSYMTFTDGPGPSNAINNVEYTGNWLERSIGGCVCFDYTVDWLESVPANSTIPKLGIYTGSIATTTTQLNQRLRAVFILFPSSPQIVDGQWDRYCAPVAPCIGGQLPSNSYGTWVVADETGLVTDPAEMCNVWNNLITNVTGLYLATDFNASPSEVVSYDNFCWTCDIMCDGDEVGEVIYDSTCCSGVVPITNLSTTLSPITQVGYHVVSGGSIKALSVIGACESMMSTTPPNVYGSTSGTVTFAAPHCSAQQLQMVIEVLPTTNATLIELLVSHQDGTMCKDTIQLQCAPPSLVRCDNISSIRVSMDAIPGSAREVTIQNLMMPSSPICSVLVELDPPPSIAHWASINLLADGQMRTFTPIGGLFNQILFSNDGSAPHGLPVQTEVICTLGVLQQTDWVGTLRITAVHCDGRECMQEFEWCSYPDSLQCPNTPPANPAGPVIASTPAGRFGGGILDVPGLQDGTETYGVAVSFADRRDGDRFLAISTRRRPGSTVEDVRDRRVRRPVYTVGVFDAVATLDSPISTDDTLSVHLLFDGSVDRQENPLLVTYLDQNGNAQLTQKLILKSAVSSISDEIQKGASQQVTMSKPVPNPSQTSTIVEIYAQDHSTEHARLEVLNVHGEIVEVVPLTTLHQGINRVSIDVRHLAQGSYVLRLIGQGNVSTQKLVVIH